ncbi:MAG: hypothetical protein RXS42_00290 [Nitrososphaeria archaeon]
MTSTTTLLPPTSARIMSTLPDSVMPPALSFTSPSTPSTRTSPDAPSASATASWTPLPVAKTASLSLVGSSPILYM